MRLTTTDGDVYTRNVEFVPNDKQDDGQNPQWTTMVFDITGFEGRDRVASIALGYFTDLWNDGTNPTWGAAFALDNIYARPDASGGVQGGPPVAKGFEAVDYGQTDTGAGKTADMTALGEEPALSPGQQTPLAGPAGLNAPAGIPESGAGGGRPLTVLLAGVPVLAAGGIGCALYRRRRRARDGGAR